MNETRFEYEGKRVCVSKKETEIEEEKIKARDFSLTFKF